jgi:predicted nuclease with TOPRIM domain
MTMTDKKLTDTEIKKALECCLGDSCYSSECSFFEETKDGEHCQRVAIKHALDLINRYEEKETELLGIIEQLEKCKDTLICEKLKLLEENESLKAEVERIQKEVDGYDVFYFCSISGCEAVSFDCWKGCPNSVYNKTRTSTYKEIADKLELAFSKTESQMPNNEVVKQTVQICRNAIRLVLNELVGEHNG